jgi:hypothetical protein
MYHSVIEDVEPHSIADWQGIMVARFKYTHGERG